MNGIQLGPTVNALLPLGAVVLTAVVAAIVAYRLKPKELLDENRALRGEVRDADDKVDQLRRDFEDFRTVVGRKVDALGRGFDAAYRLAERRAHCRPGDVMPEPDESDAADIDAALKVRRGE